MNKIMTLSFLILALFPNIGISQNLTFQELENFLNKDIASTEEYLVNKKWELFEAEIYDEEITELTFTFERGVGNISTAFLLCQTLEDKYRIISMQFHDKDKYLEYQSKMKTYGYRLVKSKVEDKTFIKEFEGKGNTIKFSSSQSKDDFPLTKTIYIITIQKK